MNFLHQDSPMSRILGRLMDLILMDIFWLVSSLPIFTIGAATAALYDVALKLASSEDVGICGTFFRAFVRNFRKGTVLFFLSAGTGALLILDFWCSSQWDTPFQFLFQVVVLSAGYFYLAMVSHVFAVLAYFPGTVKETLKKTFLLAMRNGISTVSVMVVSLFPFFLIYSVLVSGRAGSGQMLFLLLVAGFGLSAYLNALCLTRLFASEGAKDSAGS